MIVATYIAVKNKINILTQTLSDTKLELGENP
jgi:hypothetical protein